MVVRVLSDYVVLHVFKDSRPQDYESQSMPNADATDSDSEGLVVKREKGAGLIAPERSVSR